MIDPTHLKAHRTAASCKKMGCSPTYRTHQRRAPCVCDDQGRPLILLLSEGQMSDYKGAARMLHALPKAKTHLAEKSYDADWFRDALAARRNTASKNQPRTHSSIATRKSRRDAMTEVAIGLESRHLSVLPWYIAT
ncbi:hypothetical protein C3Y89_05000 [Rhizobium sp. UPM1132]|uniref:transposase n=1 Tax=Rhizobium ruizarguesonis TaxID=2081791 RepID=UPI0016AC5CEE|nr:hypothetical protein [Rhizobium ruizarguesonis]